MVLIALSGAYLGGWATISPESFYRDFPGLGFHWVSVDGPYNEHLIRDVGTLNLAMALIATVAAVRLGPIIVGAVCAGWLVYSIPHQLYHATHKAGLDHGSFVAEMGALALNVIVPALILIALALRVRRTNQS